MSKKSRKTKAPITVEEGQGKLVLISNTICQGLGKILWEGIYALLEGENPKEIEEATSDRTDETENTLSDLASSFLHRIAARSKDLPYNHLVRWVIESINITDKAFFTADGRMFRSFKPEEVKRIYHLLNPLQHYNKSFLEAFAKENQIESDPIKQWRHFLSKHKHESSGMYSVESLASPYCYVVAMVCRLLGSPDYAIFSIEMVPLIEVMIKSFVMDWKTILSDKMAS